MQVKRFLLGLICTLALAVSVGATDVTISSATVANWTGPTSNVEIRLFLSAQLVTPENQRYAASSPSVGTTTFKWDCSVASGTLTIPDIILPATTNAVGGGRVRWTAIFWNKTTNLAIQNYTGFEYFQLPASPLNTTWDAIKSYNDDVGAQAALGKNATLYDVTQALANVRFGFYTSQQLNSTFTCNATREGGIAHKLDGNLAQVTCREVRPNVFRWVDETAGAFHFASFGAVADGVETICSISSGSTTLTCGSASFSTADTGKVVYVVGAGSSGAMLKTTGTYVSATTLTLAVSASTTVAGATTFIGTDNTAAFAALGTALDAAGGGEAVAEKGNYIVTSFSLKKKMTLRGQGVDATAIWSASSGGIVKSTWPANTTTAVDIKVRDLTIRALDTRVVQTCLEEQGGTYVHVDRVRFKDCHYGLILNQTEVSGVRNSRFETYGVTYFGGLRGSTDPTAGTGAGVVGQAGVWTKNGAGTTATDGGRWQITAANTWYSTPLTSTAFVKGFTLFMRIPEIVSGDASWVTIDDGTSARYEIKFPAPDQARLNGGTIRTTGLSGRLRFEVAFGGQTGTLKIDGVTVDSNVAKLATSGTAAITWGNGATGNPTNTYWQDFWYQSANPLPASIWIVSGPEYDPAYTEGEFTNVIYIENNQFNTDATAIASDGGYEHSIRGNNFNSGLMSLWNQGSYSVLVAGNSFEGPVLDAVWLSGTKFLGSTGNRGGAKIVLQSNTFSSNGDQGYKSIKADAAASITLDGNVFPQVYVPLQVNTDGAVGHLAITGKNFLGFNQTLSNLTSSHISPTVENVVKSFTTVSPAQITVDQHDYNPGDVAVIRVTSDAPRSITGMVAPSVDGTEREIWNDGAHDITLPHQSASSTATNRYMCEGSLNLIIGSGQGARLKYYNALSRWKVTLLQ